MSFELRVTSAVDKLTTMSGVQFREIHKNSWLKKLPAGVDKKSAMKLTGGQKLWTVFCIHDDREPVLEFYADQKKAAAHRPDNSIPLSDTVHVSATICPLPSTVGDPQQQYQYEFVVTLTSDVVHLAAPSWLVLNYLLLIVAVYCCDIE